MEASWLYFIFSYGYQYLCTFILSSGLLDLAASKSPESNCWERVLKIRFVWLKAESPEILMMSITEEAEHMTPAFWPIDCIIKKN